MQGMWRTAVLLLSIFAAGCGSNPPAKLPDGPKPREASADGQLFPDGPAGDGKLAQDGKKITPDGKVVSDKQIVTEAKILPDGLPPPVCGNGIREPQEQCDDGGKQNLDGCDASCRFEQNLRVNKLVWQSGTDSVCTKNALGGAVQAFALSLLQGTIDQGIANGSISVLLRLLELDDLSGGNDPALTVGLLGGTHVTGVGYNGTADLDWWYTATATHIDAQRIPLTKLPAKISAFQLSAGPGKIAFPFNIGGTKADITLTGVLWQLDIDALKPPLVSTGGPPGHLASEHLDPSLQSFASAGAASNGRLCGNASTASLKAVPIPSALVGTFGCTGYSANNSLLDVFVGGCDVPIFGNAIKATQPDTDDPAAPAAGAGPPYTLSAASSTKIVDGCKDKNGATVSLTTCLADAAYSAFFKLACGRVIIK